MTESSLYALEREGDVNGLLRHLKQSESPAVRARAAEILASIGSERVVDDLIDAALEDDSGQVRKAAAEGLAAIDDVNVIKLLIDRATGREADLSNKPDWTLVKFLINALSNGVEVVRMDAALALGKIGDERALKPLIKALNDADPDVRKSAATALGELGDTRAVKPLTRTLTDSHNAVRHEAAIAISELGGSEAIDSMVTAATDQSEYVRKLAVTALGSFGSKKAANALTDALEDENPDVRERAAFSLIEVMSNAPAQDSHQMREKIAANLRDLDEEVSTDALITGLEKGEERSIRRNAAWLLGQIGGRRAVNPLMDALRDEDEHVRKFAATSLAQIGEPAVEQLIEGLTDRKPGVRKMCAFALGKIGDPRAIDPLNHRMEDEDEDVRRFVFQALSKVRGSA